MVEILFGKIDGHISKITNNHNEIYIKPFRFGVHILLMTMKMACELTTVLTRHFLFSMEFLTPQISGVLSN
jgi:hypothetical protein